MKDMYKTFDDVQLNYNHKMLKEYSICNNKPEYEWDYGDSVIIPFDIDECFWESTIVLTVYNFRFEPIYEYTDFVDNEGIIRFSIDSTESYDLFPKGIYYCSIQSVWYDENNNINASTLMPARACSFYVR